MALFAGQWEGHLTCEKSLSNVVTKCTVKMYNVKMFYTIQLSHFVCFCPVLQFQQSEINHGFLMFKILRWN